MITITAPARTLRSQDVFTRFVPLSADRPNVGSDAETATTGEIVFVGPEREPAIFVGVSPAGVVWVTSDARKLEAQRVALARIWSRATRRSAFSDVVVSL